MPQAALAVRGRRGRRARGPRALVVLAAITFAAISGHGGEGGRAALAQSAATFKIAFWNIQSGVGERPLPGRTCPFTENSNCTDSSLPLNAWGLHVVQDELIRQIGSDTSVVALGLAEAWICATAAAVQQVLGWQARSTTRSGVALVARYGFAGPEEWVQLDTSRNTNPSETRYVLRVPVCLDQACSRSVTTYTTHMYSLSALEVDEYDTYATQADQILDFAARASGTGPHVVIGDFNVFEGTSVVCGQNPRNAAGQLFRAAGYLDAWPSVHAPADGSTGMWNRAGCGTPEGNLSRRIDYGWSSRVNPLSMTRFGMVEPGECAPSDHAGILMEYAIEDVSVAPPAVVITGPAQNASVAGHVWISAQVTDPRGIRRLEWLLDGRVMAVQTASPFVFDWNVTEWPNGAHQLQAAATNLAGRRGTSLARTVTILNPAGPGDEVVLHAAAATVAGSGWSFVNDPTAADGTRLQNANAGTAITTPLAQPPGYAEFTFDANANTGYRLWIRGKATANSPDNDAVFVQFSDSVDVASGAATFRIGTKVATSVHLEDCTGCGLSNWGWQDNASGRDVLGPLIYFANSGSHRLRVQAREDGLGIDQVVLSAVTYRFGPPGTTTNDTTILGPGPVNNTPPTVRLTAPAAAMTVTAPASVALSATASDPDDAVARVEFLANGTLVGQDSSAPYAANWTASAAGSYVLAARAIDARGASTTSTGVVVTVVTGSPSTDEIVLHVAAAGQAQVLGGWTAIADTTAAAGARLQNPNAGAAKLSAPLATPTQAFDVSFTADAGKAYRVWLRGKALNNSYNNDSVFLQFDHSVTAAGTAIWRIGTTSATTVVLEDSGGAGVQGWGWADNGYGINVLGPLVYFSQSGPQRLRIQMREDGLGIDQVVLSAVTYLTARPGATKNDTTILPAPGVVPVSTDEVVLHVAAGQAQILGGWTLVADTTAAAGARLQNPNAGAAKLSTPLATPTQAFDVSFTADAGRAYRVWLRGKALNNSYNNDSVFLQFDHSVTAAGTATWRIGTTSATTVVLEDSGGAGVQGWSWADNGYGINVLGPLVYFSQSGPQRLRIQMREDGLGIDQVVLSAVTYLTARPGAAKNDTTILQPR